MWPDPESDASWKKNVKDVDGELLCVSQFTLMANTVKGNKPDYHRAMASPTQAYCVRRLLVYSLLGIG
jgi:D-aminoacyl-tRNA deacylase